MRARIEGQTMGRKATNTIEFNYQQTDKIARQAKRRPRREWRISGVDGLVLVTQPTGTATWYYFYRDKATGKTEKHRIGEYVPETEWKRHREAAKRDPHAPPILTLAEARRVAEEQRHAVQDGSSPVALKRARANAMTFRQLAERFLEEAPHLAIKTRRAYRYALEKDAYPAIGAMPAADVTPDHVLGVCQTIEAREIVTLVNGKRIKRSPRVQSQHTKSAIGGVFRWAKSEGLGNVKTNPARDVAPRIGITKRTRTPTDDELKARWAATEDKDSQLSQAMRTIIQLAILTAQRRDEVAGAHKSELSGLDTDNPVWKIPGDQVHRGLVIRGRTKNGVEQTVYLSKQAAELFRKAVKLSEDKEFVFPADLSRVKIGRTPRTGHVNGESVSRAMGRLRSDNGLADLTIHDMRRAASTWLKNQGISKDVRDLALNHLGQSVDERHYSAEARMETQVKAAFQAWADHVSVLIGQPAQASNVIPMPARA